MKVNLKKLTSSALSVAVLASLGGCALFDKSGEAVLEVADEYATAVTKFKAGDILDLISEPSDDFSENLESYMDHSADAWGEDYDAICGAIEGTFAYEIDEESVEASKKDGEGSVDITFTFVDYNKVYEDVSAEGGDLDDFVAALADGDTQEVTQTVNFVLDGEEWLVDDSKGKGVQELYSFYEDAFDFQFTPPLIDLIDYTEWYYSDDDVYEAPYTIELDIIPTAEGQSVEWEFYYEYYLDGNLIFTSDTCTDSGAWIESYYGESYDSQAQVNDDGTLVAGSYQCIVYDMSGNVLADSTCEVVDGASATTAVSTGDASGWTSGVETYWYTYADGAGSAMGTGDYSTDETTMEFTCQVTDDAYDYFPVYYEVYYSATGSEDDAELVYSATITPSSYSNGYFYEFQYTDNDGLDAGTYFFLGATDDSGAEMLFNETAEVS